jgi:hypothetical protein
MCEFPPKRILSLTLHSHLNLEEANKSTAPVVALFKRDDTHSQLKSFRLNSETPGFEVRNNE